MPKANVERNTFVRGLITEASPLTYPENASIEEDNFVLNREGSRQRRLGMDYESTFTLLDSGADLASLAKDVVTGFRWENVNNDPTKTFCVVQVGNKLWFLDGFTSTLSANIIGSMALTSTAAFYPLQYAAINGDLIVTNESLPYPKLVTYENVIANIALKAAANINLFCRDIWGINESGVDVEDRSGTLTIAHEYNLFNQGWPIEQIGYFTGGSNYPHSSYFIDAAAGVVWPSNSDIWYLGKNASDLFNPNLIISAAIGNRQAPRGRVLLDVFTRGSSRKGFMTSAGAAVASTESINLLPTDQETGACTTVVSYAGRIFYSGIISSPTGEDDNSPPYSGTIFFSQLGDNKDNLGKCYSVNDPTSEDFNIPLPTDGGTITIPEASKILKLVSTDNSLIVIAENGVWEITGPDGVFRADDFSIAPITNVGAVNAGSVVNAEGTIYYWSKAGIYALAGQEATGRLVAQNISENTIQTLYTAIPSVGRTNAIGRYDSDARKLKWLYNDEDGYDGISEKSKYNRELVFDTVLGAFYTNTIGSIATDSSYVAGYIPTGAFNITADVQNVVHNGVQVQVNGEDVVVTSDVRSRGQSSTKYIAIKPNPTGNVTFTFSLYRDANFIDWASDDGTGVDAAAHLITGYELFQDSMRRKYIPYLTMHFKRTESGFETIGDDLYVLTPSSCLVGARWDFADSGASGKFGTQFQAYKLARNFTPDAPAATFDYGQSVVTTKNKLRGSGRAFSMRVDTEAAKDLYLYGWAVSAEGGASV